MSAKRTIWIPVPGPTVFRTGIILLATVGALGCMDYEVGNQSHPDAHYEEDTAVPVDAPPDDSDEPIDVQGGPLDFDDPPVDDPPDTDPEGGCSDGERVGY